MSSAVGIAEVNKSEHQSMRTTSTAEIVRKEGAQSKQDRIEKKRESAEHLWLTES